MQAREVQNKEMIKINWDMYCQLIHKEKVSLNDYVKSVHNM